MKIFSGRTSCSSCFLEVEEAENPLSSIFLLCDVHIIELDFFLKEYFLQTFSILCVSDQYQIYIETLFLC